MSIHTHGHNANLWATFNGGRQSLVTDDALTITPHSGDGHIVASTDDRVFIAFATNTPLGNGTPSWVVEYKTDGTEISRWLVGYADPNRDAENKAPQRPDNHNIPQVWIDGQGHVVILLGAHHGRLLWSRSNKPGTLTAGWRDFVEVGHKPGEPQWGYTYPASVMIGETLHVAARWSGDRYKFQLVYFTIENGKASDHTVIEQPPDPHKYAIFYHSISPDLTVTYQTHHRHQPSDALIAGEPKTWRPDAS